MATRTPRLKLGKTNYGKGVFSIDHISKGKKVLTFTGHKMSADEYKRSSLNVQRHSMRFWVNEAYCHINGINAYVNHSCDPSTGLKTTKSLYALRDIGVGEEITFDYSTSIVFEGMGKGWRCRCGAKNCRGRITNFQGLSPRMKKKYAALGIVPRWILKVTDYRG